MASLAIENIPEPLYQALSDLAAKHRSTVEAEAVACIDAGIRVSTKAASREAKRLSAIRRFRASLGSVHLNEADLQRAKNEGRP